MLNCNTVFVETVATPNYLTVCCKKFTHTHTHTHTYKKKRVALSVSIRRLNKLVIGFVLCLTLMLTHDIISLFYRYSGNITYLMIDGWILYFAVTFFNISVLYYCAPRKYYELKYNKQINVSNNQLKHSLYTPNRNEKCALLNHSSVTGNHTSQDI